MAINGSKELFGEDLRAVYAANPRGAEAAEATLAAASNPELKRMLQSGTEIAGKQVERLEQVFGAVGAQPSGWQNAVMDGIIAASRQIVDEPNAAPTRNAGIIASGQIAFHYHIAAYGTLASYARCLDMCEARACCTRRWRSSSNTARSTRGWPSRSSTRARHSAPRTVGAVPHGTTPRRGS